MEDAKVLERMRDDWNSRAGEDANYYVAFGRRDQDEEEFFATGAEMAQSLSLELKRFPGRDAALEIGCGPGRLMRPMSRHFREIYGIDVSDEMIRLARRRLAGTPNAHPLHASGSDLKAFADETFDFVYSYAVFQHIPSREVVFNYLREARRVLKTGGILRCQINGLPDTARQYDTWSGVRITAAEISAFALDHDLQLLALEQPLTQYMWITCRKRPAGWRAALRPANASIRSIGNALTGEAAVPDRGVMSAISLWVENLPREADINGLEVRAEGALCRVAYIGEPEADSVTQVNVELPQGVRTGLVPVSIAWAGAALAEDGWVRVIPAPPNVPRITVVSDGVNLLSGTKIVTGSVKVTMVNVEHPEQFAAKVDDAPARDVEWFCADPGIMRYEFNFHIPQTISPGAHNVWLTMGRRAFAPIGIEVS